MFEHGHVWIRSALATRVRWGTGQKEVGQTAEMDPTMRGLILLGFLCTFSFCVAQSAVRDTTYRILTYGLPQIDRQNAIWVVGQKWGIEHYAVAGCVVRQELADSVDSENSRVLEAIAQRFGSDWEERFNADVEREVERARTVVVKIRELPYIQAKERELRTKGNGLHYQVFPEADGDTVIVRGYAPWNGSTAYLQLYVFNVDAVSGAVQLVSDTPVNERP